MAIASSWTAACIIYVCANLCGINGEIDVQLLIKGRDDASSVLPHPAMNRTLVNLRKETEPALYESYIKTHQKAITLMGT